MSIAVTPVNDQPAATPQSVSTDEDTSKTITLAGTDIDNAAASLSFEISSLPAQGKLYEGSSVVAGNEITTADLGTSLSGNQVTYDPAPNYHGADSFDYEANDGSPRLRRRDRLDHRHAGQQPPGCVQRRRLGCRRQRERCTRRCAREQLDHAGERVGPVADDHEHRHAQQRHRRVRGGPDQLQADRGQLQRARQLHLHGP